MIAPFLNGPLDAVQQNMADGIVDWVRGTFFAKLGGVAMALITGAFAQHLPFVAQWTQWQRALLVAGLALFAFYISSQLLVILQAVMERARREITPDAPPIPISLQREIGDWHRQMFGPTPPWRPYVKAVEEIGELGREVNLDNVPRAAEELGDVVIALYATANRLGIDFETAVAARWAEVQQRSPERAREEHRG